ncbi:zinc finger protein interacting with ribonucleoprotein K-like isoform X2 [Erpetoichthys calabaricus]|uniref:zinc finger protein interacting with ribonucleoprotein K-like isoform X2 n=1 Tax=Erpetoichthys calabaricus TaxID=27687 RepID=UPI00109EECA7|nr:zinc finger protein interacting with ribonucleoprotein K-like isoform X2 [Erpetoichthys calabaricus]
MTYEIFSAAFKAHLAVTIERETRATSQAVLLRISDFMDGGLEAQLEKLRGKFVKSGAEIEHHLRLTIEEVVLAAMEAIVTEFTNHVEQRFSAFQSEMAAKKMKKDVEGLKLQPNACRSSPITGRANGAANTPQTQRLGATETGRVEDSPCSTEDSHDEMFDMDQEPCDQEQQGNNVVSKVHQRCVQTDITSCDLGAEPKTEPKVEPETIELQFFPENEQEAVQDTQIPSDSVELSADAVLCEKLRGEKNTPGRQQKDQSTSTSFPPVTTDNIQDSGISFLSSGDVTSPHGRSSHMKQETTPQDKNTKKSTSQMNILNCLQGRVQPLVKLSRIDADENMMNAQGSCYSRTDYGKRFRDKEIQQVHSKEHKTKSSYICSLCNKTFDWKHHLKNHMRTHSGEKPFSCDLCGKMFAQAANLYHHLTTHTTERPHTCTVCGKHFKQKHYLEQHKKCHTGEKRFACSDCGKRFTQKYYLVQHQKIHAGDAPHCDICGKNFSNIKYFAQHQRIHTGEQPFFCQECGKGFSLRQSFHRHLQYHSNKVFVCTECGKSFTHKDSLQKHHLIHTGEKPFCCSTCGKCFAQKVNLRKHEKVHAKEDYSGDLD